MNAMSRTKEPLAIQLLNTVRVADGLFVDAFDTDSGVVDWLRATASANDLLGAGLHDGPLMAAAPRVRRLRDAARQLAAEATSDPRPVATPQVGVHDAAVAAVNAEADSWVKLDWPTSGAARWALAAHGDAADLATKALGRDVVKLLTSDAHRLRPCLAPACVYFFSKQARREWCSPACGNRARVARHYQRHHGNSRP